MAASKNVRFLSRCDQGGRYDGVQVIVRKGHAFIGHMFSDGITVVDVGDSLNPKTVAFVAAPGNTRSHHLQVHDDLLFVVNGPNVWAMQQHTQQQDYFSKPLADTLQKRTQSFEAGLRIFDISHPAAPRQIAFLAIEGLGLHRVWYVGGRYAYASAHIEGFTDHILAVIDVMDPTRPTLAGQWWLPGMWRAGGEEPTAPKLIGHKNWSPPFAGGTHTPLPLPDRNLLVVADEATSANCANGLAYTWVVDVREPANPVTIATMPTPGEEDFCAKGGKFGPHNLHENRPGSFQSSNLIFATYHNAGLRIFDIANPFAPRETGYFVPPPPEQLVDTRPNSVKVIQSCDVFVDRDARMYLTDTNAGLYILQYEGH
jgi:hypothetical protein